MAVLRDTKNGKERMVNLCPRVVAALSTLPNLGRKGPLFLRYDGRPYEEREAGATSSLFWTRAVTEMDFDVSIYTPHVARHSWATWFYSQTKDVVRLKAEGGSGIGRVGALHENWPIPGSENLAEKRQLRASIPRTRAGSELLRKLCGNGPETDGCSRLLRVFESTARFSQFSAARLKNPLQS